jgi:hypothetical protein
MLCLNKKGQWLLTFAVIFAFTVIALSVMLNEVSKYGTFISSSIWDIPYYELRSLITEITRAYRSDDWNFTDPTSRSYFINNITLVYALHGLCLNFTNLSTWGWDNKTLRMNFTLTTDKVIFHVDKNVSKY